MRVSRSLIPILVLLVAGNSCAREKQRESDAPEHDLTSAAGSTPGVDTTRVTSGENPLIAALRASFQRKNPKLTQVGVIDMESWDFVGPRFVIGWAIVGDHTFRGDFNDEMFGVFVVNDSLTRVERVLDTFATERWYDFEVRFGKMTADSIEVLGQGATYRDGPIRRVYKWW